MQLHFTYKTTECGLSRKLSYVSHSCFVLKNQKVRGQDAEASHQAENQAGGKVRSHFWCLTDFEITVPVIWKTETKSPETSEATLQVSSWGTVPLPHFFLTCFCAFIPCSVFRYSFTSRDDFDRNSPRFWSISSLTWLMMVPSLVRLLVACSSQFPSFINSFRDLDL